ncbi:spermatogenesis-associated protein 1-like isoform X2 [Clavelina lepadiformis]|uniref:spermatogenesis-associated protein 1-like isoform X2 n=1 Tax=Clavelina lepadiformis TaxID=159417 RepID=UPI004042C37B
MPSRNGMSDGGDSADLRPPSDNLVDLHISVVPMEHWVERLNYASHKIIGDTFSAGFIRVLPETSVVKLRYDILHSKFTLLIEKSL